MKDRIKKIRTDSKLSQADFSKKISVSRSAICKMESGENNPSSQTIDLICSRFSVSKLWLLEGVGDPYVPEEDETAAYVSELLEDEDNPLFDLIKGIMKIYSELGSKEKEVLKSFARDLAKNLKDQD